MAPPCQITILGSNSALPAHGRFPTSQIFSGAGEMFMIDCGEGTQMQLSKYQVKRNRISHIFISHLHGDHVYGLPGLLSSFNHFSRTQPLTVFGPVGIRSWLQHIFSLSEVHLLYELHIHEIDNADPFPLLYKENGLSVHAFPLIHRVPTWGYRFDYEKPYYNIDPDAIQKFNLSVEEIRKLKNGEALQRDGIILPMDEMVIPKDGPCSYAFCSDTIYTDSIIPFIRNASVLYHEATFTSELQEKAKETKHATAREAAEMAKRADVGKLILGHYSSRYRSLDGHLREAREVFKNSHLAREGEVFYIPDAQESS